MAAIMRPGAVFSRFEITSKAASVQPTDNKAVHKQLS